MKEFYRLKTNEMETHLSLTCDTNIWECYTNIPRDMKKLESKGWEKIDEQYYPDGSILSMTFQAPRHAVTLRGAQKLKRELTEEQREEYKERMMKNIHNK